MGCDIHAAIERKVGERWIMVNRLRYDEEATDRNYERFAKLAGVRGDGPEPKGLPNDISDSTRMYLEEWGVDAHSKSWMEIKEAAKLFLETEFPGRKISDFQKRYPLSHYFDIDEDSPTQHRLVFWFDN